MQTRKGESRTDRVIDVEGDRRGTDIAQTIPSHVNVDGGIGAISGRRNGRDFVIRQHPRSKYNGVLRVRIGVGHANETKHGENEQFSHVSPKKGIWFF